MTSKTFTKVVVAFGLLAILLVFLGVNFVPRISAFSTANENTINANIIRNVSADRWQALGDSYLTVNLRVRQADAARWQAMGEYYLKHSALVSNFDANLVRDVSAARWQALGESSLTVNLRARQAEADRWQAMNEYYTKHSPPGR
jgi:predicted metalloprotease with PDZ domain